MRKLVNIAAILIIAQMLCVCSGTDKKATSGDAEIFTDAMERQVAVPKRIERIISMAPNVTEMLFAIGLSGKIVGVTTYCDYPDAAKSKPKIGGYSDPNIEAILSLKPDLIVTAPDGYSKERVEKLDEMGIPVFVVNPKKVDEVLETMLTLGKITGKSEAAKHVVDRLSKRVKAVREKVSLIPPEERLKVFYEIGRDPLFTAGPGTFLDNLITEAGGVNIAADAGSEWAQYSVEAVIAKKPDIIITALHTLDNEGESIWRKYKTIPAVQNGRIYELDPNVLLRPGPRIVDGLEKLYGLFK
jgi:iron complex transport system substrate-binding protein